MGGSSSQAAGPPTFERAFPDFKHLQEIAPGFWHLRVPFLVGKGPVKIDVKTHMSVCRLASGSFVCIDAAKLTPEAKSELDRLTENGSRLEAVLNTHSFHTLAIPSFHALYPSSATRKWFGCPRHLKMFTQDEQGNPISWAGDLNVCEVRNTFEPDLAMRIPAGSEFVDPKPPASNHFSTVFVLHRPSKTLHVDDCIMYFDKPSPIFRLVGKKKESMHLHPSLSGPGLLPTERAPIDFKEWLTKLLDEWEFEHLVTAHIGNCYCCANHRMRECLADADKTLLKLSARNAGREPPEDGDFAYGDDPNQIECG